MILLRFVNGVRVLDFYPKRVKIYVLDPKFRRHFPIYLKRKGSSTVYREGYDFYFGAKIWTRFSVHTHFRRLVRLKNGEKNTILGLLLERARGKQTHLVTVGAADRGILDPAYVGGGRYTYGARFDMSVT